uniref:Uncharacterized protein n=1 Tax=Pithovirus LCDPAC01 TaxID=2506600 RepID=A0A481YMF1_9VIRU|nr:MAG: hypothetical protein LCDPAC01_00460 [Pithovirus LCDPAC01]
MKKLEEKCYNGMTSCYLVYSKRNYDLPVIICQDGKEKWGARYAKKGSVLTLPEAVESYPDKYKIHRLKTFEYFWLANETSASIAMEKLNRNDYDGITNYYLVYSRRNNNLPVIIYQDRKKEWRAYYADKDEVPNINEARKNYPVSNVIFLIQRQKM